MRFLSLLLTFLILVSPGFAEQRAAFILGNGRYENAAPLANPVNDARDVAATLQAMGFETTLHEDLNRGSFGRAFSSFLATLDETSTAIFYFAGHGIQVDGRNYLIGTEAALRTEFDLQSEALDLGEIVRALERRTQAALVFIDACRDNPLATDFYAANFPKTRALASRGLAPIGSTFTGTMVMFAASAGQVALDGKGLNSPFSKALVRHLPTPGIEILSLMKRVIGDVRKETKGQQNPTVTNDLAREIYLNVTPVPAKPETKEMAREKAATLWPDFRDSNSPEALRAFAREHPGTAYAALAEAAAQRLLGPKTDTAKPDLLPAKLPEICSEPKSTAVIKMCTDPGLIALHEEMSVLFDKQLSPAKGAERGKVLVEHRNWKQLRDACADKACIERAYNLRITSLVGFADGIVPKALVVENLQTQLNRLSCGAGIPDGDPGGKTRAAFALAASLSGLVSESQPLASSATVTRLRSLPRGLCSFVRRGTDRPELIAGRWRIVKRCPNEKGPDIIFDMRLSHDGENIFSGTITSGGWKRAIGGRLTVENLALGHRTSTGFIQSFNFTYSDEPAVMNGTNWQRCNLVAQKR